MDARRCIVAEPGQAHVLISRKLRKPEVLLTHRRCSESRRRRCEPRMKNSDPFEDALGDIDAAATGLLWDASASFRFPDDPIYFETISPSPLPPPCTQLRIPYASSHKVFQRHMLGALPDGSAHIDAERLISRACYEDWLSTRSHIPNEPEKTFQRILTSCVTGTDGRTPFTPAEEAAVLVQIRQQRVWPAFTDSPLTVGIKGFRSYVASLRRALTSRARARAQVRLS